MKKTAGILGLPVISISEGKEIGVVKQLVINAAEGKVAALVVDDGKWYLGAKLLRFADIAGLGESAVTVESSSLIAAIQTTPDLEQLLAADVKVINNKVLTKSGKMVGKVIELSIDDEGSIASCVIEENNGEIAEIAAAQVCTFGKEVLVIYDTKAAEAAATVTRLARATPIQPLPYNRENAASDAVREVPAIDANAKKFDEKNARQLLGKRAVRRVVTDNGMIIIEQDGKVTEEVLQKAKLAGKIGELSISVG